MNPLELLNHVPAPIRRWMGSEEVVDIIIDIEEKFHLDPDNNALTFLIFDLYVKNIPLTKFTEEIAYDLGITTEQAQPIFDEIKERILKPISLELVAFGVGDAADYITHTPIPVATPAPISSLPLTPSVSSQTVVLPTQQPTPLPTQAPVSLYKDALASQTYVPAARIGTLSGTGNIAEHASAPTPTYRPARVDLGIQSTKVDDTLKSIFVHKETRPLQEIDYGSTRPQPLPGIPVPLATAAPLPGERFDAPPIAPVVPQTETVVLPSKPTATPVSASGGVIDGIMSRIAPWHSAKFGEERRQAAEAIATPIPSVTVNYSESAPVPDTLPKPSDTPQA